jgi:hypothetical protein
MYATLRNNPDLSRFSPEPGEYSPVAAVEYVPAAAPGGIDLVELTVTVANKVLAEKSLVAAEPQKSHLFVVRTAELLLQLCFDSGRIAGQSK